MSESIWIAMIGAASAALVATLPKVWDALTGRRKYQLDEAAALRAEAAMMRKELSDRIDKQQVEIGQLHAELDGWKERYYELRDKYGEVLAILRTNGLGHLIGNEVAGLDDEDRRPRRRRKGDEGNGNDHTT